MVDTNNLISALGWEGNSKILFKKILNEEFEFVMSVNQFNEIKRVLDYPKFAFTTEQKNKFIAILSKTATIIETKEKLNIARDQNDNMLLEAALESNAEFIISGDNDLLSLKEFNGIKIVTVSNFLSMHSNNI
ncbi:MAG: putative toxin-antitoxin system toxin component, PIN family [archaeon]